MLMRHSNMQPFQEYITRRSFERHLGIVELLRVGGPINLYGFQSCTCFRTTCSPLFERHLGIAELLRVGGPGNSICLSIMRLFQEYITRRSFERHLGIVELLRVGGPINLYGFQSCTCFRTTCSPLFERHLGIAELLRVGGPGNSICLSIMRLFQDYMLAVISETPRHC